jgi:hypothetical protein
MAREEERKTEARKKKREELELRIGNTISGYNWLRRIEQIGKGQNTRFERVRKESE